MKIAIAITGSNGTGSNTLLVTERIQLLAHLVTLSQLGGDEPDRIVEIDVGLLRGTLTVTRSASGSSALAGLAHEVAAQTALLETLQMTLNAQGQALADQINTNTNKLSAAQTAANNTIQDLVDKLSQGTIDVTEFTAAVKPQLDLQGQIADALLKTATDNDPALNPAAPPIVVTPPAPPAP